MSLFLCMVWGCVLVSLICMQLSRFPSNTCWKDCLFPILCSCLLCQRLIDHRCLGLFLGSLFCSIGLYVCFGTSTTLSWLLWLCNIAWSLGELWLLLSFCTSGLLWQFWVFCGSIELFGLFVLVLWKMSWVIWEGLHWICRLPWVVWPFLQYNFSNPGLWNIFPFLYNFFNFLD